jgi:hypothetical protein
MQKLAILGWLLLGAVLGWAVAVHLWQAGRIDPDGDAPEMLLVVAGCTVLTTIYGARRHWELLPRLIAYPLLLAGLTWTMRPLADGTGRAFRCARDVAAITYLCPSLIVTLVIGGILAVSFARFRPQGETTDAAGGSSPVDGGESTP